MKLLSDFRTRRMHVRTFDTATALATQETRLSTRACAKTSSKTCSVTWVYANGGDFSHFINEGLKLPL